MRVERNAEGKGKRGGGRRVLGAITITIGLRTGVLERQCSLLEREREITGHKQY